MTTKDVLALALEAHKKLIRAYVNLLETGRDRIISHGGTCDSVEQMEASDPALREAREAITAIKQAQGGGWSDDQMISFAGMILLQRDHADSIEQRLNLWKRHNKPQGSAQIQAEPAKNGEQEFKKYLKDCTVCSIEPDIAGAFHAGFLAAANLQAIKQAITPETVNAAPPEASAITAGNGQAQEPVGIAMVLVDREVLVRAKTALKESLESFKALEKTGVCGVDDWEAGALVKQSRNEISAALSAPKQAQESVESEYKRGFNDGMNEAPTGDCWVRAVDEAMVGAHLGVADMADDYGTAKKKLNDLICWHVEVAQEPAPKQAEPEGYKLVPVEPTLGMLYAMQNDCDIMPQRGKRVWATLLAAAPTPPEAA